MTTNIHEAIDDVPYLIIATQALAHEEIAELMTSCIKSGQTIFILPGSGGSLVFSKVFRERGLKVKVNIAEALSLPYGCRRTSQTSVNVSRILGAKSGKNGMGVLPSRNTSEVVKIFNGMYPNTFPMTNVLETALCNANIIKHPVGALLNLGRIEYSKGEFLAL